MSHFVSSVLIVCSSFNSVTNSLVTFMVISSNLYLFHYFLCRLPLYFCLSAGKVTVRELVNLCKKDRPIKPPWVEDEEDRVFEGYENVVEMLEDIGVDTKKVNNHVLTAIRNIGESWGGGGWGQWMQPLPVHFHAVLGKNYTK